MSINKKSLSLSIQIKKEIGNHILLCTSLLMLIIIGLTTYDLSTSINQLKLRINEQIKPIEDFTIGQVLIDNFQTINLKISTFNENNPTFKIEWVQNESPVSSKLKWQPPFSWIYEYKLGSIAGYSFGYFKVTGSFLSDKPLIYDLFFRLGLLILFTSTLLIILNPLAKKIPEELFINPINRFIDLISNPNLEKLHVAKKLPIELKILEEKILALLQNAKEHERNQSIIELGHLATQVVHDIRSPLAVLNIETGKIEDLPEKNRINIRNAIRRVNDIANNLLSKYKKEQIDPKKSTNSAELASALLENIVSEKRVQIQNNIQLELLINKEAMDAFIYIDPVSFKRAMSNIIDNAIESISPNKKGKIELTLASTCKHVIIEIIDNGCGISEYHLTEVIKEGFSFGKRNGSGLGLPYTINKIFSWNGEYKLTSKMNVGTKFEILLPRTNSPLWFTQNLKLTTNTDIIILDDDEYIHEIWKELLLKKIDKINLYHFYNPTDLINFYNSNKSFQTMFLLDYEFIGSKINGLELAKRLNIHEKTTLVTSRYEDIDIRNKCIELGIKVIPKSFASKTLIEVKDDQKIVLIDDDEIITSLWQESAEEHNISLDIFRDPYHFIKYYSNYPLETFIYIDSSLTGNVKGEEFAKTLFELGFKDVILTTGLPKENFVHYPYLKNIIGKEPPWERYV